MAKKRKQSRGSGRVSRVVEVMADWKDVDGFVEQLRTGLRELGISMATIPEAKGSDILGFKLSRTGLPMQENIERMVVLDEGAVCLELDEGRAEMVERAFRCLQSALLSARDMSVVSHEAYCREADDARAVQRLVWDCLTKLEAMKAGG